MITGACEVWKCMLNSSDFVGRLDDGITILPEVRPIHAYTNRGS